jgi:hypothetical protein
MNVPPEIISSQGQYHPREVAAMSHPFINVPKYWRERAMEARSIAKLLNDAEAKRLLLEIGTSYERLA